MIAILFTLFVFLSAFSLILIVFRIRDRRLERERHRLIAKRKFQERELQKPRVPTKAPEPYLWKSGD